MPKDSQQRVIKKSRNGCIRCKTKRIKCDETKPACVQCTKKKLRCPGFAQQLKWSRKYEIEKVVQSPPRVSILIDDGDGGSGGDVDGNDDGAAKVKVEEVLEWPELVGPAKSGDLTTPGDQTLLLTPVKSYDIFPDSPKTVTLSPQAGAISYHMGFPFPSNSDKRPFMNVPSIPANLVHVPSLLVDYYFDKVCIMFSSFDSPQNPFRTSIARLWPRSPAVFHAIQSMAAACLADDIPQMRMIGLQAQHDAINYLQQGLRTSVSPSPIKEDAIFAIILLGLSTSWHDTQDLGLAYLHAARAVINSNLVSAKNIEGQQGLPADFLGGALVYWEMLAAMVSNDLELSVCNGESQISATESSSGSVPDPASSDGQTVARIVPHPWTGVVPQTMKLFARTAKLVRCERIRAHIKAFATAADLEERMIATIAAESLEEELLALELPTLDSIVDPGDEKTPLSHLLVVSEAYRCASLLMIYRVFPDILAKRLGPVTTTAAAEDSSESPSLLPFPPMSWTATDLSSFPLSLTGPAATDPDSFLTSLATYILSSLRVLPPTSGTRCVQPILFVIAASELRFSSHHANLLTTQDVDVGRCRGFVLDRLAMFCRTLPRKPLTRMSGLVGETWERLDRREGEVFWMDVMIEMGWETIMG